jgi:class 3 adenylate cyclase
MSVVRGSSLRARLTRTLVGLGLISVILLATVNFFVVRELLDRGVREQVVTLRDTRRDAIELTMDRVLTRVSALGSDPAVAVALRELTDEYEELDVELTDTELDELRDAYGDVVGRYDDAGVERPPVDDLLPSTTAGRYVQYEYIADDPEGVDDRAELVDAGDGSGYSAAHARHHEHLRALAESITAADLLLVDLETADVVYSVAKRVDLGTNVVTGPYADTGLGLVWDQLAGAGVDDAVVSDSRFYLPSSDAPVVHAAAAVRSNSEVVGMVVVTLPIDVLTRITTADGQWEFLGLGDTGDAYLVGADRRLRTNPRQWSEDPDGYLERFDDVVGDDVAAGLIEFTGSPVLIQEVDNEAVTAALEGDDFVGTVTNHLGQSTLAAAGPVDVDDLGWVLVTEQATSETQRELWRFVVSTAILLAILLPVLAAVGLVLARVLARPVRPLVDAAGRIAQGEYETEVPDLGRNELADVGRQLESVAAELRSQEASILAEDERITRMLSTVLPTSLIEPIRNGERSLADVVDTATVVAIVVRGIPEVAGADQDAVLELTERLTGAIVDLAARHGVEPVRVAHERQLFVAGRGEPEARQVEAARFASEAVAAVVDIGAEYGVAMAAGAGLSAGLIATGVLGSRQLSFGVWGDSVVRADEWSGLAGDGQVLVDASVADSLDDSWLVDAATDVGELGGTELYLVSVAALDGGRRPPD